MYNIALNTTRIANRGISTTLCLLVLATYLAMTTNGLSDALAEDRSTSINCSGQGPCEKTECVDGDCETTLTNSSNITSISGSNQVDYSGDKEDLRRSLVEERLSLLDR